MEKKPSFNQIFKSALYNVEGGPGWVGFIYIAGQTYPKTIDFKASFNNGHYLFAPTAPPITDTKSAEAFIEAVQSWLAQNFGSGTPQRFNGTACIWLPSGNGPMFGMPNTSAITLTQFASTFTSNNFNLPIGQLTLSITLGASVSVNERGLIFTAAGASQIIFSVREGSDAPTVDTNVMLPFIGAYAGALTMQGQLSRSGNPGVLPYFETGFHYLYAVPGADSQDSPARQIYPVIRSGSRQSSLSYAGSIDPNDLFNTLTSLSDPAAGRYRTLFAFKDETPIESWYRDDSGNSLALVPLNGLNAYHEPMPYSGALVLQSRMEAGATPTNVYMTLAGDFALEPTVAPTSGAMLLAGLFGTERFQLSGYTKTASFDRLQFQPHGPAYAPVFPFPDSSLDNPDTSSSKERLTNKYLTSWAAICNGPQGQSAYLAQPEGNPLYAPPPSATSGGGTTLLQPLATPSAIPQSDPPFLLPFVPYAGLSAAQQSFPVASVGSFESQILSSERKRLFSAISTPRIAAMKQARWSSAYDAVAVDIRQATTPQGLYAEVIVPDQNSAELESSYEKVVLAQSIAKLPATGSVEFGFTNLEAKLQSLFQTNQLMSVIVNPTFLGTADTPNENAPASSPLGTPTFNRDIVIADWRMTAAVGDSLNSTAYNNILILKYCDGALIERVKNPNKWVGVDDFSITDQSGDTSVALAGLSSFLQTYLQTAIDDADKGNKFYQNFAQIVQDPKWQGFLVLRAKVDPSGFPDQIKGLTAGIDFTQFEAHHFGATASRVSVDGTTVTMQVPSSLFGLVDYQLPLYRQNVATGGSPDMPLSLPTDGDFGFNVLQLQALFENAALVDFQSRIQLTINDLFFSPVATAYGSIGKLPATAVVLRGSYQRQGDTAVYVFEQNSTTIFTLQSNVLEAVALLRVVFNTLSSGDDGIIRSRFLIWGVFEFAMLDVALENGIKQEVDLLSFGQPPDNPLDGPPLGLAFSGLDISMTSPVDTPSAVTFVFETGKLALDAGSSQPRDHSLYTDLALEVESFIVGAEDKRPINFGFLPVSVEPNIKAISGPWFGIAYKVTMGSPGGLVSAAGFTSRILLAWAPTSPPDDPAASVFVGLQLPGAAPGAKLLSIQGVLKLSIDSLLLRRETVSTTDLAFVLRLNNIALSFLGIVKLPSEPINFFLFGDPSGSGSLGWYAAYIEQKVTTEAAAPPSHQLLRASSRPTNIK